MSTERPTGRPRMGLVAAESIANACSTPVRTLAVIGFAFLVGFTSTYLSIRDVQRTEAAWNREATAGRFAFTVESSGSEEIDAARCEAASSQEGVIAAGSVVSERPVVSALMPDAGFRLREVTPGFLTVMWPDVDPNLSTTFAQHVLGQRLGLAGGSTARFTIGGAPELVRIDQVLPDSPRDDDSGKSLVVTVVPRGQVRTCYVAAQPTKAGAVRSILASWFPASTRPVIRPIWQPDDVGSTSDARLRDRPALSLPWIAGAVIAIIGTLLIHGRRAEFGLYRLLGASRGELLGMIAFDLAIGLYCAYQLGLITAWIATHALGTRLVRGVAFSCDLKTTAVMIALPPLLLGLIRRSRLTAVLKGE